MRLDLRYIDLGIAFALALHYFIIHILLQLLFKVNLNILWGYFEDF